MRHAAVLAVALGSMGTASATYLIDPNFAVCPLGTTDVTTCGLDPNPVSSAGVTVGVIGNAGSGPLDPFLLFVAVPNQGTLAPAPTIGSSTGLTVTLANTAYYGQTTTPVAGYVGEVTSGEDIYGQAGVPDGNASMNFSNMAGLLAEQTLLGYTPTSFSLYELVINVDAVLDGANLGTDGIYDILLTLGLGSYVAAYGIEDNPAVDGTHVYDSAFTVSGFVNTTSGPTTSGPTTSGPTTSGPGLPEPGTAALLGLGMLGMYLSRRRNGVKPD